MLKVFYTHVHSGQSPAKKILLENEIQMVAAYIVKIPQKKDLEILTSC